MHMVTRAQQLVRWATVPEQSGPKSVEGLLCPFPWGAGSPSSTPGPRPISIPSGILIHPAVWSHRHGPWRPASVNCESVGGCCAPFRGRVSWIPINVPNPQHGVAWADTYLSTTWLASLSIQPFGHSTPTLQLARQTDRQTDNGPIAVAPKLASL